MESTKRTKTTSDQPMIVFERVGGPSIRASRHFNRREVRSEFRVRHDLGSVDQLRLRQILETIDEMYGEVLDSALSSHADEDMYSGYIFSVNLHEPIFIPPRRIRNRDNSDFGNALFKISQSNTSFLLSGELTLQINIVKHLVGAGNKKNKQSPVTYQEYDLKRERSLVKVQNRDNLCAVRAIVIAKFACGGNLTQRRYEWHAIKEDR